VGQFTITRVDNVVTITANNNSDLINASTIGSFASFSYANVIATDFHIIDLYKDETINLTSKLSDIEKLSNVFTDFTNTFTVPATDNNNDLFRHYYDVDIDNTFNANIRVLGYLEMDTFPLRYGKIQLEQCILKQGRPESYKITFYGGLLQISDLFDDDLLSELDYVENDLGELVKTYNSLSQFDFEYNSGNLVNSINLPTFKDGNIITPLIALADRDWNYGSADALDISTNTGAILESELRQAIKVIKLIEAIEVKYKINFTRNFFGKAVFNNLFMWLNGSFDVELGEKTEMILIDPLVDSGSWSGPDIIISDFITLSDNYIDIFIPRINTPLRDFAGCEFWVRPMLTSFSIPTKFKVYCTDLLTGDLLDESDLREGSDNTGNTSLFLKFKQRVVDYSVRLKFDVQLATTSQFNVDVFVNMFITPSVGGTSYSDRVLVTRPNTQTVIANRTLVNSLPEMKVIDFFQGIMKMFKLIIRPETSNIFYVNTLDGYYSDGNILDITDYVDNDDIIIERPLIYRDIIFKYVKTNNVAGKKFREINDPVNDEIGYGDLKSVYRSVESKERLSVELPFENMLFERMTVQQPSINAGSDTNISIGQSITESGDTFSPNNSKPILFFNNGIANNTEFPFKLKFGASIGTISYNYIIGNTDDELLNQITNTINFNVEIDPWHEAKIFNSLYLNYWSNWINTIYSLKQRKFTYNAILPPRFIEELSLNDRLIIKDQRYKINDYTINLTTNEVKLNLFKDIYGFNIIHPDNFNGKVFTSAFLYFTDFSTANSDGSYFLYGAFTAYNGLTATRIIKLNPDGSQDLTFNTTLGGPNVNPFAGVRLYRLNNDGLLVAGFFSTYNGVSGFGIRKLYPNGSIDPSLTPGTLGTQGGFRYTTKCEVQQDGKIVLAGLFSSYNGNTSRSLVRINANGSYDNTFNVGVGFNNTTIDVVVNEDLTMYVTGYFSSYKGVATSGIIKLSATASIDTSFVYGSGFAPNNTSTANYLLPTIDDNNSVYCAGAFTSYKGATANRIIKLTATGSVDSSFNTGTGFNDIVVNIRYTNNNERIFLSGAFTSYNGITTQRAIILNLDGSVSQTFPSTGFSNYYNIGDDVYATDSSSKLTKLTDILRLDVLTSFIQTNAGTKYYGINILSNSDWEVIKIDLGFDTDWIEILTPNGSGNTQIQILINEKASQTGPETFLSRKMAIKIKSGTIEKFVNILQTGL
jgi:hypothetical protein